MDAISLLGSTMGLGLVSGLNLYATVLTVGLSIRLGLITLNPELQALEILATPLILIIAGVIYIAEFVADKVPWFDSLWDAVHTLIRPLGAAVLGATAIGTLDPQMVIIATLCGGTALSSHSTKAGARLVANHSPEPFSNIALSIVEDVFVVIGVWLALAHPLVMLVLVITFLALFCWFAPKAFRLIRIELLAAFSVLKMFYLFVRQYISTWFGQPQLAGAGSHANVLIDTNEANSYGNSLASDLVEEVPEKYLFYLDNQKFVPETVGCIRCVAGKGVKGLRNSVGYLHLSNDKIVFFTRKWFRFRDYEIERNQIEDIHFKKKLLLDRIIVKTDGKQKQFFFFKDISKRSEKVFGILQTHQKKR